MAYNSAGEGPESERFLGRYPFPGGLHFCPACVQWYYSLWFTDNKCTLQSDLHTGVSGCDMIIYRNKIFIIVCQVNGSTKELNGTRFSLSTFSERTFRKAPQKAPSAVTAYGIDPSTVRVVWRYVAPSLEEEPLIGYKVNNLFLILKSAHVIVWLGR
jgi:hypothetical protein